MKFKRNNSLKKIYIFYFMFNTTSYKLFFPIVKLLQRQYGIFWKAAPLGLKKLGRQWEKSEFQMKWRRLLSTKSDSWHLATGGPIYRYILSWNEVFTAHLFFHPFLAFSHAVCRWLSFISHNPQFNQSGLCLSYFLCVYSFHKITKSSLASWGGGFLHTN